MTTTTTTTTATTTATTTDSKITHIRIQSHRIANLQKIDRGHRSHYAKMLQHSKTFLAPPFIQCTHCISYDVGLESCEAKEKELSVKSQTQCPEIEGRKAEVHETKTITTDIININRQRMHLCDTRNRHQETSIPLKKRKTKKL